MSQEEHGAISQLTATVEVLVTGLTDLKNVVKDQGTNMDARITALSERGRFNRSDVFALLGTAVTVLGGVAALIAMSTDVKLAPIRTENQVSIVDRAGLHEDVLKIFTRIDAGKETRFAEEKATAVRLAILEDHDRQRAAAH